MIAHVRVISCRHRTSYLLPCTEMLKTKQVDSKITMTFHSPHPSWMEIRSNALLAVHRQVHSSYFGWPASKLKIDGGWTQTWRPSTLRPVPTIGTEPSHPSPFHSEEPFFFFGRSLNGPKWRRYSIAQAYSVVIVNNVCDTTMDLPTIVNGSQGQAMRHLSHDQHQIKQSPKDYHWNLWGSIYFFSKGS